MKADKRLFWADRIANQVKYHVEKEPILQKITKERGWICYDEKSPSGRIHIGSGRGWVIHDTVARVLRDLGLNAQFILSSDDMDPLDKLPKEKSDYWKQFMGIPLRSIPSPVTGYNSFAEYYFNDVTEKFEEFGIEAKLESTGDHYYNGDFNKTIKLALDNADQIDEIYRRFYETSDTKTKLPFNPICQNCGRIGTTRSYEWIKETELVKYKCETDLVPWAKGCGFEGEISPYNGNGKFPWKVEWAAKWPTIGVVYETAGKDHFSAGGSRDVAIAIAKEIFDYPPPYPSSYKHKQKNSHKLFQYRRGNGYEFFNVSGTKMSTSKGRGFPFAEMTQYAPGNILKFLLVRTRPKTAIDFEPKDLERVYRDYDDTEKKYYDSLINSKLLDKDKYFNAKRLYELSHVGKILPTCPSNVDFNFGIMIVQLTKDSTEAISLLQSKGKIPLNLPSNNKQTLTDRLDFFQKWVNDLAPSDKIINLSRTFNKDELTSKDKTVIQDTITLLKSTDDEKVLVKGFKNITSTHELETVQYYRLLYQLLFGTTSGPRLISYIIYAGKEKIIEHLAESIKDN
ncbi:MAG: lysine--tRNA ligase [Candidatus Hodarchaeales archaeon]